MKDDFPSQSSSEGAIDQRQCKGHDDAGAWVTRWVEEEDEEEDELVYVERQVWEPKVLSCRTLALPETGYCPRHSAIISYLRQQRQDSTLKGDEALEWWALLFRDIVRNIPFGEGESRA